MARVSTTKIRQARVVLGPVLLEGLVPDPLALYAPDGTPIDPTDLGGGELPPILVWGGSWDSGTVYEPNTIVTYNNGFSIALWITVPGSAAGIEPGSEEEGIWSLMIQADFVTFPDLPAFYGPWSSEGAYPPLAQVLHNNGLWVTGGSDPGVEPGVEIDGIWQLMVQGVAP